MNFEDTKNNIIQLLKEYPNKYFKLDILYKKYINRNNINFNNNPNIDKNQFDLYFLNVIRTIYPNTNNISIKTSKYFISHLKYYSEYENSINNDFDNDFDNDSGYDSDSEKSTSSIDSYECNEKEYDNIYRINYQQTSINKKLINFIIDNNYLDFIYLIDYKNNNILHYLVMNNDSYRFSKVIELLPLNYLVYENNKRIIPLDYTDDNSFLKNIIYKKIIDKIDLIEDSYHDNNQKVNSSLLNLNCNLFVYTFMSLSLFYILYTRPA